MRSEDNSGAEIPEAEESLAEAPPPPWLRALLCGGAFGLLLLALADATVEITENGDVWWGMAAGRYITEHREIPRADVFSHTFAGRPWINPEWLTHVLYYNLYHHLGENSLVVLRGGLIVLIFGAALALCVMRSRSWLVSLPVVAFGAWVCRVFLDCRPQLFTFLYSVLLLLILHLFRRRGQQKLLFLIPLILFVWAQQHGGFIFGILLLAGNLAAESGKRLLRLPSDPLPWDKIRSLAVVTLIAALAVLANPWTYEAYVHPLSFSKAGGSNAYLEITSEWVPPRLVAGDPASPVRFWVLLLLAAVVILPVALVRWRSFDFNDVGLAAVLALVFALQHRRFIPLFTILTLPLLAWAIRFWVDWLLHGRDGRSRWRPGSPLPAGAARRLRRLATAAGVGAWLLFAFLPPLRLLKIHRSYAAYLYGDIPGNTLFRANTFHLYYPEQAIRFLRQAGVSGHMFNFFNWGGYLQFFLPEQPVFIDGRGWTVYDERHYGSYLNVHWAYRGWSEVLDRFDVSYALVHRQINEALVQALDRDPRWRWVFANYNSAIFLRDGPENRDLLDRFAARELPLPEGAMTYFLYGRDAAKDGDFEQAASDFARAVALFPEDGELRDRLIEALVAAGRVEEAESELSRAREEAEDSAPIVLAAARLEAAAGRGDEVSRIFRDVVGRWPGHLELVDRMLAIDPERGRGAIEEAYRGDPRRPWLRYLMGRLAELDGELERAGQFYFAEGEAASRGAVNRWSDDYRRMLRSQQHLDRVRGRLTRPARPKATAEAAPVRPRESPPGRSRTPAG